MTNKKGKIGIFDSGLGGLSILKEVVRLMPDREYLYLGDNLHAPYGDRPREKILEYTWAGVEWLFDNGAEIVVLACNTASANALRKIQQEFLPIRHGEKRVLGIIVPTVENMHNFTKNGHVGILATEATIASGAFEKETKKYNQKIRIVCQSGGKLAGLIEEDMDERILLSEIEDIADKLILKDSLIDAVVLGCTHYSLLSGQIREIFPKNIKIIGQGKIIAEKLADYLDRHDEIRDRLSDRFSACFYTTSGKDEVKEMMVRFYGAEISITTAAYEIG